MSKLLALILLAAIFCSLVCCNQISLAGENTVSLSPEISQVADLKDQLEKGLKLRRPEEFVFISRVVDLVASGRLPLRTVYTTFIWARPKKPAPFPFFERAIKLQAAKLGVAIK